MVDTELKRRPRQAVQYLGFLGFFSLLETASVVTTSNTIENAVLNMGLELRVEYFKNLMTYG